MLIVVQTLEQQCHRCPCPSDQPQQQHPAPDKQRRSAAISFLDAGWSSSGDEAEDSGADEFGGAEPRERLATLVDEDAMGQQQGGGAVTGRKGGGAGGGGGHQRPESLKIIRNSGAGSRKDSGRSRRTMAGCDPTFEV